MSPQARAARFFNESSSGWARPLGWARPVYINRHPQPPPKDTGFSGISQSLYARVKIRVDSCRALGYSGIYDRYKKSNRLNLFTGPGDRAHEVKR